MFNFLPGPEMMGGVYGQGGWEAFGGLGTHPFGVILLLLFLVAFVFWVAMLVDMIRRPVKEKTMWALLFIFTNIIGAIIYFFTDRKSVEMEKHHGHHQS